MGISYGGRIALNCNRFRRLACHDWRACLSPLISIGFAALLLAGGLSHWRNPYYFLGSVYAYELAGPGICQVVAMMLPSLELLVAAFLITGVWLDAAHAVTMVMFAGFTFVQGNAFFRGLDISCGCFGPCNQSRVDLRSLLMISALLLISVVINAVDWMDRVKRNKVDVVQAVLK